MNLSDKFHPDVFKTSAKMTAVLAFILGEEWTEPTIMSMIVTSDYYVFINMGTEFFADFSDLQRNLKGCADAVGLDRQERQLLESLANWKISFSGTESINL